MKLQSKRREAGREATPEEVDLWVASEPANGPALAGAVAGGFGTFMLGLFTTLAEASESIKTWLTFSQPVGPLSGKVTVAVASWAFAWIVLGLAWRTRNVSIRTVVIATMVLLALGILGTFPTFFEQFAPE